MKNAFYFTLKAPSVKQIKKKKLERKSPTWKNGYPLSFTDNSQKNLWNVFRFKDHLPFDLVSGVVYKCTCGIYSSTYYGEMDRHSKVRSGEHIGISTFTFKKTKPSKERAVRDHLLNCNNTLSFEELKSCLKSKKACLLNEIELFWIKASPLLYCFFLTIVIVFNRFFIQ